jgi:hydroxymethylpyrimidine/phosphomethylpyrimidine kinase
MHARPPSVLSIAGSDSGGGAGLQADLKSFAALGVHGLTAVAALTAQTSQGVVAVHLPPVDFLRTQILALLDDFDVRAIKIGMLADAERIECVARVLADRPQLPVVLDPVMVASSGAQLLDSEAVETLRRRLLPLATVLTPNLAEAEVLVGHRLDSAAALAEAAATLRSQGATWVLMKGGHLAEADGVHDRLFGPDAAFTWSHPRLALTPHGTGCSLASTIAAGLALGQDVPKACAHAVRFVELALRAAACPGRAPLAVLDHFTAGAQVRDLAEPAIPRRGG